MGTKMYVSTTLSRAPVGKSIQLIANLHQIDASMNRLEQFRRIQ